MTSTRITRLTLLAAATVLGATLTACGGDDSDAKTLDPTSPAAVASDTVGSTNAAAPSETAVPVEDPAVAAREWLTDLNGLIATDTTPAQKTAAVSGGDDLLPTFTKLAPAIKGLVISFKVKNPVITGETGKADIVVVSGGEPFPDTYPAFFDKVDGAWLVNRAGACSLIALSGVTCPDNG